jgi:transcriptional regulator with XRE-family HTH domain
VDVMEVENITNLKKLIYRWGIGHGDANPLLRFARAVHINQGRVSEYWNGKVTIPARHLLVMADELGVDPEELLG